jgi:SSS family solute:Na+ symporter
MLAMHIGIAPLDLGIVVAYFVLVISIGCLAGHRNRRLHAQGGKDYFLAGGTLTWPIIGLALFSTNISTIHLVTQAQEGYMNGLAYGNFEWMAPFTLIALSLFFAPFYIRSRVATLPDFLEKRYSRASRNWLALMSIVSAVFIHIGFSLYAGALVLRGMFGINLYVSIIGVAVLTGLYTIVGGLLAVVITESIQTVILLVGAFCITGFGLYHVGGWHGLAASVEPVKLTILRSAGDPSNLPWYSVFLGYPIIGLWYWCADQTIVQRVLGAKDEHHARVGPLFAGFIKILPVFIFFLPGTIALALVNQGNLKPLPLKMTDVTLATALSPVQQKVYDAVAAQGRDSDAMVSIEQVAAGTGLSVAEVTGAARQLEKGKMIRTRSEDVYAHMIVNLLPTGIVGIVAAALLAALMSTVSGALNSIATLFCYDIYKQLKPDVPDRSLVLLGRIVTFIAMVAAIIWSPFVGHYESIYQGICAIICYIAPPITAVFVWGVFWRRASASGALWTLVIGTAMGAVVFVLDWCKKSTGWNVPFMMATFYLFCACTVVLFVVSIRRPDPPSAAKDALCWGNPLKAVRGPWRGVGDFRLLAGILFAVMVALYVRFA